MLPLLRCRLSSLLLGTLLMHYTIAAPSAAMSPASGVGRLPRSRETAAWAGDCEEGPQETAQPRETALRERLRQFA